MEDKDKLPYNLLSQKDIDEFPEWQLPDTPLLQRTMSGQEKRRERRKMERKLKNKKK